MAGSFLASPQSLIVTGRGLRLASGIVLFTYVATHLLNHAAGLVSLATAEAGRQWFLAVWRSLPGTALFYGALAVHIVLAFTALLARRTLRMPSLEAGRILLGLCVPVLLAAHFAGTRLAHDWFGLEDDYARVVGSLWGDDSGVRQLLLMAIGWLHGCLGVHFILRHRPAYRANLHFAFAAALLLPVLSSLGFLAMGRELDGLAPASGRGPLDPVAAGQLSTAANVLAGGFVAALALVLVARGWRTWRDRRSGLHLTLAYPGRTLSIPRGWSVLEASRAHGIDHLSLCGGRARCSTCRVRVAGNASSCPPPAAAERRTLDRIGAAADVRLACQLRPTGDLAVTPLLRATGLSRHAQEAGTERELAILFIDLRRWTTLSEQHLPHDLAYVLDQFFEIVGDGVRSAGGVPNQFIGDSVMAIFGLDSDLPTACRQALRAAQAIESGMAAGNERLHRDFGQRLEFGIGIHAGRAAVGEVGWQATRTFTAVGDVVNTAARLQELCKAFEVQLVVSDMVLGAANVDAGGFARQALSIRGRQQEIGVYPIRSAAELRLR
jgi:adenylate cyclase